MSYDGNQTTPAGWYADPAGSPRLRWWDGTAWTEHFQADAQPQQPAYGQQQYGQSQYGQSQYGQQQQPQYGQAAQQQPAYGQQLPQAPAYAPAAGYAPATEPRVPEGTPAYGPFIWIITLLPLLSLLLLPFLVGDLEQQIRSAVVDPYGQDYYGGFSSAGLVAQIISTLVGWVICAAVIVLSYLDYKWLLRTGYARPFHWAWSFFALVLPLVYPVGRSLIVRRRSGRGIAPMWVAIGVTALSLVIAIVLVVYVFNLTFTMMSGSYGSFT